MWGQQCRQGLLPKSSVAWFPECQSWIHFPSLGLQLSVDSEFPSNLLMSLFCLSNQSWFLLGALKNTAAYLYEEKEVSAALGPVCRPGLAGYLWSCPFCLERPFTKHRSVRVSVGPHQLSLAGTPAEGSGSLWACTQSNNPSLVAQSEVCTHIYLHTLTYMQHLLHHSPSSILHAHPHVHSLSLRPLLLPLCISQLSCTFWCWYSLSYKAGSDG